MNIKTFKKDIIKVLPKLKKEKELRFFLKRFKTEVRALGVKTLNKAWEHFPSPTEDVAEKIFFRPKQHDPNSEEEFWQRTAHKFKVKLPTSGKEIICMKWGRGRGPIRPNGIEVPHIRMITTVQQSCFSCFFS